MKKIYLLLSIFLIAPCLQASEEIAQDDLKDPARFHNMLQQSPQQFINDYNLRKELIDDIYDDRYIYFRTGTNLDDLPDLVAALILDAITNMKAYYVLVQHTDAATWKDPVGMLGEILLAANNGDAAAQTTLGYMYYNNIVLSQKDFVQASTWWGLASKKMDSTAQYYLAHMYESGENGIKDIGKAVKGYIFSAKKGNAKAMNNLGFIYTQQKKYEEAFQQFQQAAKLGVTESLINIGVMYEDGNFVTKDHAKAYEYYNKALEKGSDYARIALARLQ